MESTYKEIRKNRNYPLSLPIKSTLIISLRFTQIKLTPGLPKGPNKLPKLASGGLKKTYFQKKLY